MGKTIGMTMWVTSRVIPIKIHLKNRYVIFEESPSVFAAQIHEEIPQFYHTYLHFEKLSE
jgi:hypothetical protein